MRILLVDDEPAHASMVTGMLRTVLDAECVVVSSVEDAVHALHDGAWQLVITDVFIPLGDSPRDAIGPRARRIAQGEAHLGGLALLDEVERLDDPPLVLAHTACTEAALFDALDDRVAGRVHKPASADQMLVAVLEVLGLPVPR